MKKFKLLTLVLAISLILCACGGGGSYSDNMGSSMGADVSTSGGYFNGITESMGTVAGFNSDSDYCYDETYDEEEYIEGEYTEESESVDTQTTNSSTTSNDVKQLYENKLVYRCNMSVETLDYSDTYNKLKESISKYEGIVESEYFTNDSSKVDYSYSGMYKTGVRNSIVVRIPSANYNNFVNESGNLGNITSKQTSVDNITQKYYDTTAQVEGLEKQLARLQAMLDEATEVYDMIEINEQITEIEYRINSLTTEIRTMDMDTTYSYVTIEIVEVVEYTEGEEPIKTNTFVDRLKNQIVNTWENVLDSLESLLFSLIAAIPVLIILVIVVVVFKIVKKKRGNKKNWMDEALEVIKDAEEKEDNEK